MERYVQIKDSGVDWIREIPNTWCVRALFQLVEQVKNKNKNLIERNLLSLSYGKIKRKDINNPEGLLPESFDGYNIIEANDIVLRLTDLQNDHTSLRVGQAKERGIITSAYTTLRPTNIVNPQFLYYVLHAYDLIKGFYGMGSGVRQGLNFDEVKAIRVPFPPVSEQSAIVAYLDDQISQIDSIIAEAKTSIEEYKQWKASIIFEAVTKGLDPNVEMRNSGVDWIGVLPNNWKISRIKNLGTARNGLTYSPANQTDEGKGTLVIRSSNIRNGKFVYDDNIYVSMDIPNEMILKKGDIVICSRNGSRNLVGKNAYFNSEENVSFGAFMMVYRVPYEISEYMYWVLNSGLFNYYLPLFFTSTINQLTRGNFNEMKVPFCPNESDRIEIVAFLKKRCAEIDEIIEIKNNLITDLEQYKSSLIYEVVTGKRKVV